MIKIAKSEFRSLLSKYLTSEWKQDDYEISEVSFSPMVISAKINMTNYFVSEDGNFHFTILLAFNIIAQLGIIHGCLDNNIKSKNKEVFLREINLKCKKKIYQKTDISIIITVKEKRNLKEGIFYSGKISIQNDAFIGYAKYVLPKE